MPIERAALGREFDVPVHDSRINVWRYVAAGAGPWPAVFLLMDAPGLRPALHEMAARIAGAGYLVWMPNLYHRLGREISVGPTRNHPDEAANRALLLGYLRTLDNRHVIDDVKRLVDALAHDASWNGRPIGLTGYCMSGRFAALSALEMPEKVACAASYFGTRLVTDAVDSPHVALRNSRTELYFAFAEHDPYVPPEHVETLRRSLRDSEARHQIEVYAGTEHGFVFPDRGSHDEGAAARHWDTLFALLERNLRRSA